MRPSEWSEDTFLRFVRSQCEKLHLIQSTENPTLMGLYVDFFFYNGRLKRPLISNISISSINASERSERALGGGAVSRLKLGARLMMRGKGDTYQKRKGARFKYKE